MNRYRPLAPLVIVLASFATNATTADATLFDRIGGAAVMTKVVDEMVVTMAQDPSIKASLEGVNLARFSRKLYVHMCATTGGPCVYTGDDMQTTHQGMNLTRAQLDASSAALKAALIANGVGPREIDELTAIRAPMKEEILRQ